MSSININNYNGSGSTMSVLVTEQCVHERELMKSDFVRLHWVSDTYMQLAVGAYISYGERNYTLLDAYLPNEQSDGSYLYEPEFKAPEYILSRTPLLYSTILYANVSTGEADTGERTWVSEWTTTGLLSTILDYIATYIKEVTNDSTKCSVVITDNVGLKASASCSFSNMDILSGLAEVATQFDGEYMLDLANHKLYFGKSIKIARASACTLKVGSNVNVPSISESKEDYYNVFKVYGSTRNIAAQNSAGEAVQSDARLQLGSGYTDSEIDTRYALDADGRYTLTNGAKVQVKNEPKLTKILTFEDIYPHLKLYVYAPIEVQKYRLDDDKRKIPVYNSDGTPATDNNGNAVYELYSRWFVRLAWYDTQTSKWKDYVYDRANQIADTKLTINFSANEEGTHSALAGREFELTFVSNAYTEESVTGNINITSGYYYINFVEENGIVIPTTSVGGLVPFGEGYTLAELNGGSIDVEGNDTATLINLALSADHITSAQGELQVAAWKEIKKELATDTNNYTFDSNPVAFNASNPSLKLGDIVNYVDGSRYPESAPHTTRVLKLVTKLDYSCEEEITIGDAVIKGNTESVQESVARTDNNVNVLTSLSEANANILQAYNRTQAAIQQSLARYTQMFDFDTDGNIRTTYNFYSTQGVSACGLSDTSGSGSGSSSGGVDMVSVWSALLANTNEQISLSHLTTALANYYNKTEVNGLLSQLPKFAIKVVGALPTSDISATTIYLITDTDADDNNLYKEYLYINNEWELIGAQKTNITNLIAKVDGSNDLLLASGSTITKENLLNGYLKSTDIADWAKASAKPTYTASEVGALPSTTEIPENVSDLTDDIGIVTTSDAQTITAGKIFKGGVTITEFADTISTSHTMVVSGNKSGSWGTATLYAVNLGGGASVFGYNRGSGHGVFGCATNANAYAVYGEATNAVGVRGYSANNYGVTASGKDADIKTDNGKVLMNDKLLANVSGVLKWDGVALLKSNETASSATKLLNARTLWGQSFDGTQDVRGNMSGIGSIASNGSTASGQYATALGMSNTASATYASALGYLNNAAYANQFVGGRYNANGNNAFEVGNGTSDSARSNAMSVDWSGNMTLKGGLNVGGEVKGVTNMEASDTIKTKTLYIGNCKLYYDATNDALMVESNLASKQGVSALGTDALTLPQNQIASTTEIGTIVDDVCDNATTDDDNYVASEKEIDDITKIIFG